MLINAVKISEEVLNMVAEQIARSFGSTEDEIYSKLVTEVPEVGIIQRICEKLDAVREDIRIGKLDTMYNYTLSVLVALQEIPDLDEDLNLALDIVSASDPRGDIVSGISAIPDKRATSIAAKVSNSKQRITELSKKLRDATITARDAVRIYTETLGSKLLKDKFAGFLAYISSRMLRGTDYELGNTLGIPAHIDIHVIKVLLRLGVLQLDKDVLTKYTGSGRYVAKILPIYAKLAPDEPYKTLWDVLRRKALDVFKELAHKLNVSQVLLSCLISYIGKKMCLFNDDYSATSTTCPVKGLKSCPLAIACKTYAGLLDIKVFSRRQSRILLRYFGVPAKQIEEIACELLMF